MPYFFKIHFNIILPCRSRSAKRSPPFRFSKLRRISLSIGVPKYSHTQATHKSYKSSLASVNTLSYCLISSTQNTQQVFSIFITNVSIISKSLVQVNNYCSFSSIQSRFTIVKIANVTQGEDTFQSSKYASWLKQYL
jgi:hypothetical protein